MELALAVPSLETSFAAVMPARPVADGDGVDIAVMRPAGCGSYSFVNLAGFLQKNGADVTVGKAAIAPAPNGVEVWGQLARKSGTLYWWLEGVINGGNDCIVAGAGGFIFPLQLSGVYTRLAIVGLSSDVAHIPNFGFMPIEHITQVVS